MSARLTDVSVAPIHIDDRPDAILWLLTTAGFAMVALGMMYPPLSPHVAAAAGILVPLAWIDLRYGVVSDDILLASVAIAVFLEVSTGNHTGVLGMDPRTFEVPLGDLHVARALGFLLPGAICGGLCWVVRLAGYVLSRAPGMGMGDVKLMFVLGLLLGLDAVILLYLAICMAGVFAAGGMIAGKLAAGRRIPFVPFLVPAVLLYPSLSRMVLEWLG